MKPLISLIIPVYNSDDFLPRSIEAFQNLLYSKMELILVDDGSTDSSLSICKQFAKKDSRIKVFHKIMEEPPLRAIMVSSIPLENILLSAIATIITNQQHSTLWRIWRKRTMQILFVATHE